MGKLVPAPGLKGIARSLIEVSLHGDPIGCIRIEIHNGVIVGHVLEIFKMFESLKHWDCSIVCSKQMNFYSIIYVKGVHIGVLL